jgi:hypothetical protein
MKTVYFLILAKTAVFSSVNIKPFATTVIKIKKDTAVQQAMLRLKYGFSAPNSLLNGGFLTWNALFVGLIDKNLGEIFLADRFYGTQIIKDFYLFANKNKNTDLDLEISLLSLTPNKEALPVAAYKPRLISLDTATTIINRKGLSGKVECELGKICFSDNQHIEGSFLIFETFYILENGVFDSDTSFIFNSSIVYQLFINHYFELSKRYYKKAVHTEFSGKIRSAHNNIPIVQGALKQLNSLEYYFKTAKIYAINQTKSVIISLVNAKIAQIFI